MNTEKNYLILTSTKSAGSSISLFFQKEFSHFLQLTHTRMKPSNYWKDLLLCLKEPIHVSSICKKQKRRRVKRKSKHHSNVCAQKQWRCITAVTLVKRLEL